MRRLQGGCDEGEEGEEGVRGVDGGCEVAVSIGRPLPSIFFGALVLPVKYR